MSEPREQSSLLQHILSTDSREALTLIAQGMFPLPPDDLIAAQVTLATGEDAELAAMARSSLLETETKIIADVIRRSADPEILRFFGRHHQHPLVMESVITHRDAPAEVVCLLAAGLDSELQEILLLRQDLIVEHPEVLDNLESNPALSQYSKRRIGEYRQHLVGQRSAEPAVEESAEVAAAEEDLSQEQLEAEIRKALDQPLEGGERDETTGLSEAQIRTLPIPVRLKLARGASRTLRNMLIRDKNPNVALAVLRGNALSDAEVEQIAANRSVVEEVLANISRDRQWSSKYSVVHNLVRNPRTSVAIAVQLVSRLSIRDLRNLSRDRNVSEAVRARATRLYRIKVS